MYHLKMDGWMNWLIDHPGEQSLEIRDKHEKQNVKLTDQLEKQMVELSVRLEQVNVELSDRWEVNVELELEIWSECRAE